MTKIEKYKSEKYDHCQMASHAYESLNTGKYYRSDRDKHGLSIGGKWFDRGEGMGFLTGHQGFYGSSGCTYEATPRMRDYLVRAINIKMKELIDLAIELSEKDAEDEAKSVLKETA